MPHGYDRTQVKDQESGGLPPDMRFGGSPFYRKSRTIGHEQLAWLAEETVRLGRINSRNFSALQACADTEQLEAAKLLLDQGMDYNRFRDWAESSGYAIPEAVEEDLAAHWKELNDAPEHNDVSEMGKPTIG